MTADDPLSDLVLALKRLPGVGPRSAQRLAFHLLQNDRETATVLGQALLHAVGTVCHCQHCNTLTHTEICGICADPTRNPALLCVVETPADLQAIESTRTYQGYYYVLMGRAAPLDGVHPDALAWPKLQERIQRGLPHFMGPDAAPGLQNPACENNLASAEIGQKVQEVIIATNFTNEGEATAVVLSERLSRIGVHVSRLARGVPIGAELEYTDPTTVARALLDRRGVN